LGEDLLKKLREEEGLKSIAGSLQEREKNCDGKGGEKNWSESSLLKGE